MYDTLVINGETVTEAGPIKANVAIKDGRVAGLLAHGVKPEAAQVIDAQGKLVFPGIIDAHVHLRTAHSLNADTMESGSIAEAFFNAVIEEGNRISVIDFGLHCTIFPNPDV